MRRNTSIFHSLRELKNEGKILFLNFFVVYFEEENICCQLNFPKLQKILVPQPNVVLIF
ncbi:unnamed protein product [Meloidogyne enterolobii]|uniref:Uncharacterized protein n=1 Tax=Meloidogyne enterolobii TaxID=390850 RepID=A0ACB1A2K6_MELEN